MGDEEAKQDVDAGFFFVFFLWDTAGLYGRAARYVCILDTGSDFIGGWSGADALC